MPNEVTIKVDNFAPILKLLEKLPVEFQQNRKISDKALREAAPVLVDSALAEVPDGANTGSRLRQSKKSKRIWDHKLRTTIASRSVKLSNASFVVVGAKNPEGNMSHFLQAKTRRHILWGKKEAVAGYRYMRDWMRIAWRRSQSRFMSKVQSVLTKEVDKIMKGK